MEVIVIDFLFTCGKATKVAMQSRLLDKKTECGSKGMKSVAKKPEFPLGKMPVFPAKTLQIVQSHNREMKQVTYLRNLVGRCSCLQLAYSFEIFLGL